MHKMTELNRVIYDIERCTCHVPDACRDCSKYRGEYTPDCMEQLLTDALKLLKAQPDVVQCGECKHYKDGFCYNPNTYDGEIACGNTSPKWYCADGKRREEE